MFGNLTMCGLPILKHFIKLYDESVAGRWSDFYIRHNFFYVPCSFFYIKHNFRDVWKKNELVHL